MSHKQYAKNLENRIERKTEMLSNCTKTMARSLESKDLKDFRDQSLLAAKWSEEVLSLQTILSIIRGNAEGPQWTLWKLNQAQQDKTIRPQDAGEAVENVLLTMQS